MGESVGVLVRALVAGRAVRLLLVEARQLAERTRVLHGLGPSAALVGGEALVAAALSSAQIKGEEQLTLQIQGSDPRFAVYVDETAEGSVRARVSPPDLHLASSRRFSGMLLASKHAPRGDLYRGVSGIEGQTLEEALSSHVGESTQVDAILRLGCSLAEDGSVASAGGLMLERLPDEPNLPSITRAEFVDRFGWVRRADLGQLLTQAAFGSLGDERIEVLERSALRWQCRCSVAKITDTLAAIDPAELRLMIEEDHGAEVVCHFCTTAYRFTESELRAILAG